MNWSRALAILMILPLLSACDARRDSFTLVCDTEKQIEIFSGKEYSKSTEKESLTFKFENQNLNEFACFIWSSEEIRCYQFNERGVWRYHDLHFDRVSGHFRASRQNGWHSDKDRNTTIWQGQCQKSTKAKF
jgi:hypothetical protein